MNLFKMLTILHGPQFLREMCVSDLNQQQEPVTLVLAHKTDEAHFLYVTNCQLR